MQPLYRGILVAALHCMIVLSVAGKYAWDRAHLPRVWVNVTPVDPNLPVRGRYLSLQIHVNMLQDAADWTWATLSVVDGKLLATRSERIRQVGVYRRGSSWVLSQPVAFFLPEHATDPTPTGTALADGDKLWAEVSVPREGPPRPMRLGVKNNGVLRPLSLQ